MDAELQIHRAKLDALASDMAEVKNSLASIATSLSSLAVLEQKHAEARDGIKRAHDRIDDINALLKDEVKGHEKRIQAIEIAQAKSAWIERLGMVVVMAIIGAWAKGMF